MGQPRLLWILRILLALVLLSQASFLIRDRSRLAGYPLDDDAFYALTVARQIALGHGISIDGKTLTNGFQPLFTFATIPAFWIGGDDRLAPLRYVWIVEFLLYLGAAWLMGRVGSDFIPQGDSHRRELVFLAIANVYLCSTSVFLKHYNGLETGCLLFLLALTWRYYQVGPTERSRGLLTLGILLGLIVLTRIDSVFLVVAISAYQWVRPDPGGWPSRSRRFAILSGVPFLISSPWWLYNLVGFGSLIPSSGRAQQEWLLSGRRILHSLSAISEDLLPAAYAGHFTTAGFDLVRAILAGFVVWLAWRGLGRFGVPWRGRASKGLEFGGCLVFSCFVLIVWYTLSSWAYHHFPRYFSPLFLPVALAFGWMCLTLYEWKPAFVGLLCSGLTAVSLLVVGALQTQRIFVGNVYYDQQIPLVRRYVPDGDVVAAGQSGNLGYFRDRVVNLDGKVNPEALGFQDQMTDYLQREGIRWVCDWPGYVSRYLGEAPESKGWNLVAKSGGFVLYHQESR